MMLAITRKKQIIENGVPQGSTFGHWSKRHFFGSLSNVKDKQWKIPFEVRFFLQECQNVLWNE